MKKIITKLLFLCFVCVLLVSCGKVYNVGDIGPAGGYIFYDCDADNNVEYADLESGEIKKNKDGLTSAECGWRYLEAAPTDLDGSTVETTYRFGYYRTSSSGSNLTIGTGTAIGIGKANTEALVKAMGETTYTSDYGTTEGRYAAKACADYSITVDGVVYDDWFLPSKDELDLMYCNLKEKDLGSFANFDYWSSSEDSNSDAWRQDFDNGSQDYSDRISTNYVRPVRAFK